MIVALFASLLAAQGGDLGTLAAIGVLAGSFVSGYVGARMVGPNRRKVIEEASSSQRESWRAALDTALEHYEADNARLRGQVDELEKRFEACADERDELRARVHRLLQRFAELGEAPPA